MVTVEADRPTISTISEEPTRTLLIPDGSHIPSLMEVVDGKLLLNLHAGQERVWNSTARFVFMLSGLQSGKTEFGPHWLYREITNEFNGLGDKSVGVGDFLAATSTYDLFKMKMLPALRHLFEDVLHIARWWAGDRILELTENLVPGGKFWARDRDDRMYGRIILRSAQSPSGLESSTAKAAWLDEVGQPEFTVDAWRAVLGRLTISRGRILGTTTIYNLGWMKTEVYDKWEAGDPHFDVIQFDSTENPMVSMEEFLWAKEAMPPFMFNMRYRGRYDTPAGLVYPTFDTKQCIIDRFNIPDNWMWYSGHDFGSVNPAALFTAQDPSTGLFFHSYEFPAEARSVYDQVQAYKQLMAGRLVLRRAGGSHQEQGWRDDYTNFGWPIAEPSVPEVSVGIGHVFALHSRNKIIIFRDLTHTIDEKLRYSYKLSPDARTPTDVIENKSSYHMMDAERSIMCGFAADVGRGMKPNRKGGFR